MERIGTNGEADYSERQRVRDVAVGFTAFASGDVVIAKITPCFENGKSAWLDEMPTAVGFGTTELHVLRPNGRLRPELMLQWMRLDLFRQWGEQAMVGAAGQKRVPPRFVRDFVVAASPSSNEQAEMVRQVRRLNSDHEQMRKRILREIDLILEYRDAMIASTVMGQLDVRQVEVAAIEGPDLLANMPRCQIVVAQTPGTPLCEKSRLK
jgi:type I restriction enzyme S subunit